MRYWFTKKQAETLGLTELRDKVVARIKFLRRRDYPKHKKLRAYKGGDHEEFRANWHHKRWP